MYKTEIFSTLMKEAQLSDVITAMVSNVKQKPQDQEVRIALINLYCMNGDYDKALQQIAPLALMEKEENPQSELLKNLLLSELLRIEVLAGKKLPILLGDEMPEWINLQAKANHLLVNDNIKDANSVREQAFSLVVERAGESPKIGNFSWISDSDSRIGPAFEFIFAGGYRWLPFDTIEHITINQPTNLLHMMWLSASVCVGDQIYHGYVPARYPVISTDDSNHKLGKRTDWRELGSFNVLAYGRKMFLTDKGEFSVTEIESILMND